MENTLQNMLNLRYQAEIQLYRTDRRMQTLKEEIAQARYDQRLANVAATEYKGSLQSFFHRFSGKQAEREEELARQKHAADDRLDTLLREQETLCRTRRELTEELCVIPTREELTSRAGEDPEFIVLANRLEVDFTAEMVLPLLEEAYDSLMELRQYLQERMTRITSHEEAQRIQTMPGITAEQCIPLLQRMKAALDELEIPFAIPPYLQNPVAYLITASDHLRRDRINQALDQVLETKKQVSHIQETLGI